MSKVRTFRAASMKDALAIISREMGDDAVILESRELPKKKRLLRWFKSPVEVEVTARVHEPAAVFETGVEPLSSHANSGAMSSGISLESLAPTGSVESGPAPGDLEQTDRDSPVAKAVQIAAELERRGVVPPVRPDSAPGAETAGPSLAGIRPPSLDQAAGLVASLAAEVGQSSAPATESEAVSDEVAARLGSLQKMVENLSRTAHFRGSDEIPPELFEIFTQLIDADMEDEIARELIFGLRQSGTPEQLADPTASRALLSAMVESSIRCTSPILPQPGRRKVVALVGPTGVGKTTTIAKLAANFRLRDGIKMGLVTVDTYRIAAVEQLRTYAEIIDLPMKVVTSPQEMRQALDELAGLDLILIDTAGRSPRDEPRIQELKTMLAEASVDEVHVVMSLSASVRSIRMTCEQFGAVSPTALILTKLDEAAGMGSLLSVSKQVTLPVSYLTTGQDVPEDIEPASSTRISRLVLGQDRVYD
jgi:flagellar biosynthesis protein FlhF